MAALDAKGIRFGTALAIELSACSAAKLLYLGGPVQQGLGGSVPYS